MMEFNRENDYNKVEAFNTLKEYDSRKKDSTAHLDMVERGEKIVQVIAVVGIIFAIISIFTSGNIIGAIINIAICLGLMAGKNWVRILYIVFSVIGIIVLLVLLGQLASIATVPVWLTLFSLFSIAVSVTCIILLSANQSVLEFFEYKRCKCN